METKREDTRLEELLPQDDIPQAEMHPAFLGSEENSTPGISQTDPKSLLEGSPSEEFDAGNPEKGDNFQTEAETEIGRAHV